MASFNSFKGKKKEGMYLRVRTLERMTFQISFLGQISKDEGLRSRRRKKERDEGEKIRHELLRNSVVNIRIKIRESAFPFFFLWEERKLEPKSASNHSNLQSRGDDDDALKSHLRSVPDRTAKRGASPARH